jgi:hypothetical protein
LDVDQSYGCRRVLGRSQPSNYLTFAIVMTAAGRQKPLPKSFGRGLILREVTRQKSGAGAYLRVLDGRLPKMLLMVFWAIILFWKVLPTAGLVMLTPLLLYEKSELLTRSTAPDPAA